MAAGDRLAALAADCDARGYDSLAASVRGVAAQLKQGDPVDGADVRDSWIAWTAKDAGLLRLLGAAPYLGECAFPAAVGARVVEEIDAWLEELSASIG